MRILVVEDDIKTSKFIKKGLEEESYGVDVSHHGDEAIYLAQVNKYDIILLDIMMPGTDGINICKTLRERGVYSPIIMITASDTIEDKVKGLNSGADDYLTKPFSFEELLARIRVQMRNKLQLPSIIMVGDLSIDTNQRNVTRNNKQIHLTLKEYALLTLLARNKDKILTETVIKDNLSDMAQNIMSNIVNVYIYRLRNKIDKANDIKLIHTVRGSGYMLSDKNG